MAWFRAPGNPGGSLKVRTASGAIASFETNMANVLQEVKCEINATGGNGTPDNPNPINGYTAVNLTACGVNLLPKCNAESYTVNSVTVTCNSDGTFTSTGTASGGSYLKDFELSAPVTIVSGMWLHCLNDFYSATLVLGFRYTDGTGTDFTLSTNDRIIDLSSYVGKKVNKIRIYGANGTVMNGTIKPMFLTVNTASDYAPYNGQTYTVAFGQTVYGGVLDVTRGKLHVTWGSADLGSYNYTYDSGNTRFLFFVDNIKHYGYLETPNFLCSIYKGASIGTFDNQVLNYAIRGNTTNNAVFIRNTDYTDAATFKTAMSGVIFAYELATPFDIDLTPVQIEQLLGKNNVWHDANGDTEVKFLEVVRN